MKKPAQRRASRLILLDSNGRILLLRHAGVDGGAFWAPPGGGLEEGETFEEAARREAFEELGVTHPILKRLWECVSDFIYIDHPVTQHECFFLVEGEPPNVTPETRKAHAQEGILEMRWWTKEEIDLADEPVFPKGLAWEVRKFQTDCDAHGRSSVDSLDRSGSHT